jgi:hypothetical protein
VFSQAPSETVSVVNAVANPGAVTAPLQQYTILFARSWNYNVQGVYLNQDVDRDLVLTYYNLGNHADLRIQIITPANGTQPETNHVISLNPNPGLDDDRSGNIFVVIKRGQRVRIQAFSSLYLSGYYLSY